MLKACKYCGRIHPLGYVCAKKPKSSYVRNADIERFRNSKAWKDKREDIKERDNFMCVACFHNLRGTIRRINQTRLSVHHIKALVKAWALRFCDENLITLCEHHHELAEKGEISPEILFELMQKGCKNIPPEC